MADVHQQVDHLKKQIDKGAEESKQYLATLKKRVEEYDTHNKFSENASAYMQSGIDTAMKSVDELKEISTQLREQTKSASNESILTAQSSLEKVNRALCALQQKAREYDSKFTNSRGSQMAEGVENVVNSTRQRVVDVIEMASEQAMRVKDMIQNTASEVASSTKHTAQVATGENVKVAETVDEKLGVTPMVQSAVGGVAETVKNLDKRMHVSETAAKIDAKVTGGLGTRVVHKGVEMVQESIDYVTDTLQHAKMVANKSPTAQQAETHASNVAQQASETAGAVGDKVSSATDQAKQTACEARQKTMDIAGSARDTAMGVATSAKDKVMGTTEKAEDMAGQASDMAKEQGARASETAHGMAGSAAQKGSEMKEAAKQTAVDVKDRAGEMGTATKEATMGMSSGESATDESRRKVNELQHGHSEGYIGQVSSSAEKTAREAKEKLADVQSRQKAVMKESTHA